MRAADEAEQLHTPAEACAQHLEHALQLWDAVDDAEQRTAVDIVVGLRAAAMASRAGENSRAASLADAAAQLDPPSRPVDERPRSTSSGRCTCCTTARSRRSVRRARH